MLWLGTKQNSIHSLMSLELTVSAMPWPRLTNSIKTLMDVMKITTTLITVPHLSLLRFNGDLVELLLTPLSSMWTTPLHPTLWLSGVITHFLTSSMLLSTSTGLRKHMEISLLSTRLNVKWSLTQVTLGTVSWTIITLSYSLRLLLLKRKTGTIHRLLTLLLYKNNLVLLKQLLWACLMYLLKWLRVIYSKDLLPQLVYLT